MYNKVRYTNDSQKINQPMIKSVQYQEPIQNNKQFLHREQRPAATIILVHTLDTKYSAHTQYIPMSPWVSCSSNNTGLLT